MDAEQWRVPMSGWDRLLTGLVYRRRSRVVRFVLEAFSIDVLPSTEVGDGLLLRHATGGVIVHPRVTIGRNVTLYQHVTIGRADVWVGHADAWPGIRIGDDVILCAGAAVVSPSTATVPLVVGDGTVVGANSVLTQSTGAWEVWAGIPARKVSDRPRPTSGP